MHAVFATMFGSNIIGNLVTNGTEASTASGVLINAGSGKKNMMAAQP